MMVITFSSDVLAKKKRGRNGNNNNKNKAKQIEQSIKQKQESLQKAKALSAAAKKNAEVSAYQANTAHSEVQTLVSNIERLESHIAESVAQLQDIELSILESADENAQLAKALEDAAEAEENYIDLRNGILNSTTYKAAYQRALASSNKLEELPRVRRVFFQENSKLQVAESVMDAANTRLEVLMNDLLHENEDWRATAADIRESKAELTQAKSILRNSLLDRTAARSDYRDAAAAAAKGDYIAQRSQQLIKELQAKKKKASQNNSRSRSRKR